MLKKYLMIAAALFVVGGAIVPLGEAQAAGLVPCGQTTDDGSTARVETDVCTLCHLIIGINDLITWGRNVMTIIAIVVITAMGILYIVSLGNPALMETAKKGIFGALIGVGIMLGAWLIVNVTLTVLAVNKASFGSLLTSPNTFQFQCIPQSQANSVASVAGTTGTTTGTTGTTTTGTTTTTSATCPGVNADALRASLTSGSTTVCAGTSCSRTCTFPSNISSTIDSVKASQSLTIDTRIVKAIICRENSSLNLTAVGPTGDCGLMQVNPATLGQTSCTSPVNLFDLQTNLRYGITNLQQNYNRAAPTSQQVSLGITKIAMMGAGYNCCANGQDPNGASADCSTANGWPAGMTRWACPLNPGTGTFNMCAVKAYACDVEACVNRY